MACLTYTGERNMRTEIMFPAKVQDNIVIHQLHWFWEELNENEEINVPITPTKKTKSSIREAKKGLVIWKS